MDMTMRQLCPTSTDVCTRPRSFCSRSGRSTSASTTPLDAPPPRSPYSAGREDRGGCSVAEAPTWDEPGQGSTSIPLRIDCAAGCGTAEVPRCSAARGEPGRAPRWLCGTGRVAMAWRSRYEVGRLDRGGCNRSNGAAASEARRDGGLVLGETIKR
jgi:hypothetical protein